MREQIQNMYINYRSKILTMIISRTADEVSKKFKRLYQCFRGQALHWWQCLAICPLDIPEIDMVAKTRSSYIGIVLHTVEEL